MTPTPPTPDDDILDLLGADEKPAKGKAKSLESDFEKELEALFAEDLTEPVVKAPAAPTAPAPAAPAEDVLDLGDFLAEPAGPAAAKKDDEVLDLGAFAMPADAAAQDVDVLDLADFSMPATAKDEDVLDLSSFAAGGADITPPEDVPGGKDGGIDTAALDDLITGLGDSKAAPAAAEQPLDSTDMGDLLGTLGAPKAAPLSKPADDMLDLSLGDLVAGMPAAEPLAEPAPVQAAAPVAPDLEISLPDLSDPDPGALADVDLGGDLNLSLPDLEPATSGVNGLLGDADLDLDNVMAGGMMEGLEAADQPPQAEQSLDPAALLEQIDDGAPDKDGLLEDISLGDVALGVAGLAAAGAAAMAFTGAKQDVSAASAVSGAATAEPVGADSLREIQEKLAALATQVTGGSVAVVRLEGQLAQKDQAIAALEQRLTSSREEAMALRRELSDLRAQLEETLRQRAQADEKTATALKERLALVEDRQIQIDRDVRTEIERAVPREAARVIREEIAAMAASLHEE